MTVGINKDRHARIIIECPEITLHPEAGYIFADCSRQTQFFLQFGGGPYIFQHLQRRRRVSRIECCAICKLETHLPDSGVHRVSPSMILFVQPMARAPFFIVVVAQPTRHLFGHVRSRCVIQTPLPCWGGG